MKFIRKLRLLFRRKILEAEMAEEMRLHLELQTERNVAAGMKAEEARYAALRQFGGVEQIKEVARDQRSWVWLDQFFQDVRYAVRSLRKTPGFTFIAVASLALGIGANTAVFSLAHDSFGRSLPVKNPEDLVLFDAFIPSDFPHWAESFGGPTFSWLTFERMRDHNEALSDVFAFARLFELHVSVEGVAEGDNEGLLVAGDFFRGLGVPALLGRTITPDDERADAPPVTVISHRYWQRRFGGAADVLGQTIVVNRTPLTIVGVTPPEFTGMHRRSASTDLIFPLSLMTRLRQNSDGRFQPPGTFWWITIMGRLKPGISMDQVRESFAGIFQESAIEGAKALGGLKAMPDGTLDLPELRVVSGRQGMEPTRWENERGLLIAMGFVVLALLIACANVANLLLARGMVRHREIAVRLALGATRSRLVRQLFTESMMLAALGGGFGVLLAYWGKALLGESPQIDFGILGFTIAVSVFTGLLFGLMPALRATRLDLNAEFQAGGRNSGGTRSALRLGRLMMIAQVALSLVLLVGAGLLMRTLINLRTLDLGINREHLLLFRIDATYADYSVDQLAGLQTRIVERIEALPGVRSAAFSQNPWLSGSRYTTNFWVRESASEAPGKIDATVHSVSPGFFETMEMPVLRGRGFTRHDDGRAPKVALVNQALIRKYFGGADPIGRRIGISEPNDMEIVGVVRDAKDLTLRHDTPALVFLPIEQTRMELGRANFVVRVVEDSSAATSAVRAAIRAIDGNLPLLNVRTQENEVEQMTRDERMLTRVAVFFGGLALMLTCIGLYGLMSYSVERRSSEIGIRIALGALPRRVLWMVLRESLRLVLIGVIAGLAAAYASGRLIATMLFGLTPDDPLTHVIVSGILVAIALVASWLPARRAAKVDPMVALRCE